MIITSKQICEKYNSLIGGFSRKRPTPVFENPDSSDYKELYNSNSSHFVRFLANNSTKKVYVWDGFNLIHSDVIINLGIHQDARSAWSPNDPLFVGIGKVSGNKVVVTGGSDSLEVILHSIRYSHNRREIGYLKKLIGKDWAWVNKYLDCTSFFNSIKDILKDKM